MVTRKPQIWRDDSYNQICRRHIVPAACKGEQTTVSDFNCSKTETVLRVKGRRGNDFHLPPHCRDHVDSMVVPAWSCLESDSD